MKMMCISWQLLYTIPLSFSWLFLFLLHLRIVYARKFRSNLCKFLINFFLLFLKTGRFGRVIIVSKDGEENLLRTAVWKELRMLDDIIQNTTVDFDGDTFSYRQICARWENECYSNDILNLDYILPEVSHQSLAFFKTF